MIDADKSDETAGQLASAWPGTGTIVVDRDSTTQPSEDRQILSMPLRREQLFRALCRAAGLEQDATGSRAAASGTPASASRALNLLLVEDNQVNQVVASGMLKKLGHTVTLAENGRQALEALQQSGGAFDIVLMDCQMPVMDGYEATRNIRANPEWRDLPVIAVTANVMQGDRDDCLESGMNDYMTKPYNRADLESIIDRWAPPQPPEG